jgi:Ribonuclease G/E
VPSPHSIARNVEKEMVSYLGKTSAEGIIAEVNPAIAEVMNAGNGQVISRLEAVSGKKVRVLAAEGVKYNAYKIKDEVKEEVLPVK